MGLGKTLQIIALLKADKEKKPFLIACPKSLVFNWKTELARFDGKMKVVEIYGPEATRSKLISSIKENEKAIYYIASYDSLRLDVDNTRCLSTILFWMKPNTLKTSMHKRQRA